MKTGKILLCFRSAPVFRGSPLAQQAVLDVEEYSFIGALLLPRPKSSDSGLG